MASQISMFDASAKLESLLHLAQSKPEFFTINVLPSNQDLDNRTIDGLKKLLVNPLNIVPSMTGILMKYWCSVYVSINLRLLMGLN